MALLLILLMLYASTVDHPPVVTVLTMFFSTTQHCHIHLKFVASLLYTRHYHKSYSNTPKSTYRGNYHLSVPKTFLVYLCFLSSNVYCGANTKSWDVSNCLISSSTTNSSFTCQFNRNHFQSDLIPSIFRWIWSTTKGSFLSSLSNSLEIFTDFVEYKSLVLRMRAWLMLSTKA